MPVVAAACALVPLGQASAESTAPPVSGFVNVRGEMGGEEAVDLVWVGGDVDTLRTARGVSFAIGVMGTPWTDGERFSFDLELSAGARRSRAGRAFYDNASLSLNRNPIEFMGFFRLTDPSNQLLHGRVGGGLTYHLNPRIIGTGVLEGEASLDDEFGWVAQADVFFQFLQLGVRYTGISYTLPFSDASIGASGIGVHVGVYIGHLSDMGEGSRRSQAGLPER